MKIKKGQNMKNNIEVPKETINKKCNKIAYTEQDLTDIFNWNPLENEEWNGFHIASSDLYCLPKRLKKEINHL